MQKINLSSLKLTPTVKDISTLKILELLFIFLLGIAYGAVHLEPAYFVQLPNWLEVKNYM